MPAEELRVVLHHAARRVGFARKFERPAAADPAVAVGPPHLLAGSREDALHGRHRARREQRHAAREIADLPFAFRAVESLEVVVAPFVGGVAHRVARIEPQGVEIDPHRTFRLAAAAHQAVLRHFARQHPVAAVAQKVNRLHVVDAQHALQLAGVDADAAPRAGFDLEAVGRRLLLTRAHAVTTQEDERDLGEDMHVARKRQRDEEDAERDRIEPPRPLFEHDERRPAEMLGHERPQPSGQEASHAVDAAGDAFGREPRRKDEPQCREGDPVARHVSGRAAHSHRPRAETFGPCQRHARQDEEQQQVHHEIEEGLLAQHQRRREVLEEDMSLQRHPAQAEVGHRFDPPHHDEQEPAEGQRHVHVSQQRIDAEDTAMEQAFADHLPDGSERPRRRDAEQHPLLVRARQFGEPHDVFPRDDGGHHQSADEKRQAEGCVKLHRQKSPSLRLISITTPRVLIPRGQASRHLPHNMHLFISS